RTQGRSRGLPRCAGARRAGGRALPAAQGVARRQAAHPGQGGAAMRALVIALVIALGGSASAEVIGVYAPSAPFDGPVARLEFVSKLASLVGPGWSGRAFAKAGDLAAAIKRGEVKFAVLDAPYVAAIGVPYQILAT